MAEFKFSIGQKVRIRETARKANAEYVRDNTYGTVKDIFEIVSCHAGLSFKTSQFEKETPNGYFVTPVGKAFSAVAMDEDEIEPAPDAGRKAIKPVEATPVTELRQRKKLKLNKRRVKKTQALAALPDAPLVELDDLSSFMEQEG